MTMSKEIIRNAYEAWNAASELRARRLRCKRYAYGDQWCDIVRDSKGRLRVERDVIEEAGDRAVTNNLIRQLVKTIVGRYRAESKNAGPYAGMERIAERNELGELDSRLLEEFLISGCAIQRISEEERFGERRLWIDNVDPAHFFVNRFKDPRGWDIDLAGMLHDMTFPELVSRFARGSAARAEALQRLYGGSASPLESCGNIGGACGNPDFFRADSPGRCRVAELWTIDSHTLTDGDDLALRFRWHCRWLAPDGTVLDEYDSPYGHGSHPFAVKFYPLTDGEVHSFVEDMLEQQRTVNRMLVLIDRIIASTAKGVILFPIDQIAEGMTWKEICNRWAQADGVIPISGRGEHLPQQVMNNPGDAGAYQYLQLQMKLFEDISGVNESLAGSSPAGTRGAELYESQVRNATIALGDIFETYASFIRSRNAKALDC